MPDITSSKLGAPPLPSLIFERAAASRVRSGSRKSVPLRPLVCQPLSGSQSKTPVKGASWSGQR
eukprot:4503371-Prymnesium_polylepis.1